MHLFSTEQLEHANLSKLPPTFTIFGENHVEEVVRDSSSSRQARPAAGMEIVEFEQVAGGGGGGDDDGRDGAETEEHDGAVLV